ncbi:MAG: metallophosphoesterase, partial [bacterium]
IKGDNFLIGLGDYVDRKRTSLRTLTFLLIIALKNPGKVILLRGNHEDVNINLIYKMNTEIEFVFGADFIKKTYKLLVKLYELMPSVIYAAQSDPLEKNNDFLIFSHALLDFKFDPREFLDFDNSELMKHEGKCFCLIKQNIFGCEDLVDIPLIGYGFIWHDIGLKNSETVEFDVRSNRYSYKPDFIKSFCKKYSSGTDLISGMVGGHEHYLAKYIHLADKDTCAFTQEDFRGAMTPAVAYIKVADKSGSAEIKTGLVDARYAEGVCFTNDAESGYSKCFTMVKFVSAPIDDVAYRPTYLVISRCVAESLGGHVFWNYKVVECS